MCWPHSWNFFNVKKSLFQTLIWNRCFLLWTLVFCSVWGGHNQGSYGMNMFVHVFWEWKRVPMPSSNFSAKKGHFHLPHLPNSSKNHHEISWDHTVNINMQFGHSRFWCHQNLPQNTHGLCTKVGIKMIFHWTMGELQDPLCIWWKDSNIQVSYYAKMIQNVHF